MEEKVQYFDNFFLMWTMKLMKQIQKYSNFSEILCGYLDTWNLFQDG